jgi:hypothetical protein
VTVLYNVDDNMMQKEITFYNKVLLVKYGYWFWHGNLVARSDFPFVEFVFSTFWCRDNVIPQSYTMLLEGVLVEKKCRQKHGGFSPEMMADWRHEVPPIEVLNNTRGDIEAEIRERG